MALEIECKFLDVDFSVLRQKMQTSGALFAFTCTGTHWERNQIWDSADRKLYTSQSLLRVRERVWRDAAETVLTFKGTVKNMENGQKATGFKVHEEYEVVCSDGENLRAILAGMGYQPVFGYDKIREVWHTASVEIVLDSLAWGDIVELEGTAEAINHLAEFLELDHYVRSTKSYAALHSEWRTQQGLAAEESFFLPDNRRDALFIRLTKRL